MDYDSSGRRTLFEQCAESQVEHGRIALMDGRFVEDEESHLFRKAIRALHFDESVDVTDGRNEIGKERLPLALQLQNLRPESGKGAAVLHSLVSYLSARCQDDISFVSLYGI